MYECTYAKIVDLAVFSGSVATNSENDLFIEIVKNHGYNSRNIVAHSETCIYF